MTTSTTTSSTREYRGTVVPAPGVYDLDQGHTTVEFIARHLMITKVRGRFGSFSGAVTIAEVPEESSVEVTIVNAASVDTSQAQRVRSTCAAPTSSTSSTTRRSASRARR